MITALHGDKSKVNACMIKEKAGHWSSFWSVENRRELMEGHFRGLESILSTRMDNETFRNLIDFLKGTIPDTPISKIEKALVSWTSNLIRNIYSE